jgi:hypothetical protein
MNGRAALAAVIVLAAGLAACSSSSSGGSTAAGSAKPSASASGTETIYGKLTGPAMIAQADNNAPIPMVFTGPVATTASIVLGKLATKGESVAFKTPVGDLAITFDATIVRADTLVSTCLVVVTGTVPFTVDGAKSTGKFAGAIGTGKATLKASGDLPKLSSGTCVVRQHHGLPFVPKTAVFTFRATIKLTIRK